MSSFLDMRSLKEDFARANAYAKKQDTYKALEQFIQTLESYSQVKNDPKAQETEYLINDIFSNLTSNKQIIDIFKELGAEVPRLKINKNNFESALSVLNALKSKLSNNELQKQEQIEKEKQEKLETSLRNAEEAVKNHETALAKVNYKRYVNDSNDKKQALFDVVESLKKIDCQDLIMEFCEIAIRLFPKELDFCYSAINAAVKYQDFDSITGYYICLFQVIGKTTESLIHKANTLVSINKSTEALNTVKEILSLEPDNPEAHAFIKKHNNQHN